MCVGGPAVTSTDTKNCERKLLGVLIKLWTWVVWLYWWERIFWYKSCKRDKFWWETSAQYDLKAVHELRGTDSGGSIRYLVMGN